MWGTVQPVASKLILTPRVQSYVISTSVSFKLIAYRLELDQVYLNLKTLRVLAIFPNQKKSNLWRLPKPKLEKTRKLKLNHIHFWTKENFAKKRCILAKFWSKFSLKPVNSMSFEPIFSNWNSKNFRILKPEKFKPEPQRGN